MYQQTSEVNLSHIIIAWLLRHYNEYISLYVGACLIVFDQSQQISLNYGCITSKS